MNLKKMTIKKSKVKKDEKMNTKRNKKEKKI